MNGKANYNRFFKRKSANCLEIDVGDPPFPASNIEIPISENPPTNRRIEVNEIENSSLERDPRLRP